MNITFDELKTLFETDPASAEVKVQEIMDDYIGSLPTDRQQRAQAFNWRIQQELRHFKDPIARMNRMVEMFWIGVKEFQTTLKNPEQVLDQKGEPSVVKFPKKS
jgi:hypothetical protein